MTTAKINPLEEGRHVGWMYDYDVLGRWIGCTNPYPKHSKRAGKWDRGFKAGRQECGKYLADIAKYKLGEGNPPIREWLDIS